MNPIIKIIKCPLCGSPKATIHQYANTKKTKSYYYRCYETEGAQFGQICGTIQPNRDPNCFIQKKLKALAGIVDEPAEEKPKAIGLREENKQAIASKTPEEKPKNDAIASKEAIAPEKTPENPPKRKSVFDFI